MISVIFSPESPHRFNFLEYEFSRPDGGLTENVAQLFAKALEMAEGGRAGGGEDSFWRRAQLQMLRNAIDYLGVIPGAVTLPNIYKLIISAPIVPDELNSDEWKAGSYLWQHGQASDAMFDSLSERQQRDFHLSCDYWLKEFSNMDGRTRANIVSGFTSMADGLLRGLIYELFCTTTTIKPEWTQDGAIIVLDLPTKRFGQVGTVAQGIFKYLWQQATERRQAGPSTRPVFLWADESQFFVNQYDMDFQTTARSSKACTVYLSQNISNYYAKMGGEHSKSTVDSLLGNFQTKIFHTNGDAVTNRWAAEQIGRSLKGRGSYSGGSGEQPGSASFTEELMYNVEPSKFLTLRNGGLRNGLKVGAYIFKAGKRWASSGQPHLEVTFSQTAGQEAG